MCGQLKSSKCRGLGDHLPRFSWLVLKSSNKIPCFCARWNASEVTDRIRASPFSAADLRRAGKQSLMSSACARWLIANWISYPSFDSPSGIAMTPALQMRISSWFSDFSRSILTAWETELSDVWSHGMHAAMTASAALVLRPVK